MTEPTPCLLDQLKLVLLDHCISEQFFASLFDRSRGHLSIGCLDLHLDTLTDTYLVYIVKTQIVKA